MFIKICYILLYTILTLNKRLNFDKLMINQGKTKKTLSCLIISKSVFTI